MQVPISHLATDVRRGSRLLLISLIVSTCWVALLYVLEGSHAPGEMATSAAIPLMVSYLMIRGIMWLASGAHELSEQEKSELEKAHQDGKRIEISAFLAMLFVVSLWLVIAGSLSALIYWGINLDWAMRGALTLVRGILFIVAATAVIMSIIRLCRPSVLKIARFFHDILDRPIRVRMPLHH